MTSKCTCHLMELNYHHWHRIWWTFSVVLSVCFSVIVSQLEENMSICTCMLMSCVDLFYSLDYLQGISGFSFHHLIIKFKLSSLILFVYHEWCLDWNECMKWVSLYISGCIAGSVMTAVFSAVGLRGELRLVLTCRDQQASFKKSSRWDKYRHHTSSCSWPFEKRAMKSSLFWSLKNTFTWWFL